ncbi:MAG TPA: 2-phospho-L-lactate transferase [Candidatus Binatia bacterium]|nr:2-phospho-L-lactate transferase [Candidatus Binatia bacterium]
MRVVELAGGVGGAKLAHGLAAHLGPDLTVVVNTGDDLERHGLVVWPDHDTVLYTLAGLDDRERGWGLRDETWTVMAQLERLGEATWFRLGDRDIATHLLRTEALHAGRRPTEVALDLQRRFGITPRILPMSDDPVRTVVDTDVGRLEFQEYFVRLRQGPTVRAVTFVGIEAARPTPEVEAAIAAADLVVLAPSNPIVSIGPILAVPGLRDRLLARRATGLPVVGVSPIVAGRALKGPADRMLASLGHEVSAAGVATIYRDILTGFVLDALDAELAPAIETLGLRVLVTDTIMTDDAARARLGEAVLDFGRALAGHRSP